MMTKGQTAHLGDDVSGKALADGRAGHDWGHRHRRLAPCRSQQRSTHNRRGSLLLIVLVTIVIVSLSVYTFMELMHVEEQAASVMTRQIQSRYLVDSGVDYARRFLGRPPAEIREAGGMWDNQQGLFTSVVVAIDQQNPALTGRFSIVAPGMDDAGVPEGYRFGLVDESSKINLNALPYFDFFQEGSGRDILMSLPDMTEPIADAILDWIDPDDDPRDYGTESSYYTGNSPPYEAKNGPLDSLDELLLIRDVTPELLFGLDNNRNGILDDSEAALGDVSATQAAMVLGWANYLTLYSKETNLNRDGLPRININGDDLEQLYDDLKSVFNDDWANFIIHYRTSGPVAGIANDDAPARASTVPVNLSGDEEGLFRFRSVLDLIDQFVTVQNGDPEDPQLVTLQSPLTSAIYGGNLGATLPLAMSSITVYDGPSIPGRINIMQAPRIILEQIPGMDSELLDSIMTLREFELDDPEFLDINRQYETWLLAEFLVTTERMQTLIPYICAGGDVYRAEVIGYFPDGRATSRAEVVMDTTTPLPKIIFWRDKSHLETGYSVDALGIELASPSSR